MTKDDLLTVLLFGPFLLALFDWETTVWCVHMSVFAVVGGSLVGGISYFLCRIVSRLMALPGIFCTGTAIALTFVVALLVTDHYELLSDEAGVMIVSLAWLPGTVTVAQVDVSYQEYLEKKDRERRFKAWRR